MSLPPLRLPTRCAHWGWDDHRYFGHAAFGELLGRESFMGMVALSVTGRRCTPECAGLLDELAVAALLSDPRIWPLKLTRLVAAYGRALPAVAAGYAIYGDARIGPSAVAGAAYELADFHAAIAGREGDGALVRSVVEKRLSTHRFLAGFGVPFRGQDERLVAFREAVRRRGRDELPHFRTMDAVSAAVRTLKKLPPNFAIGAAAALLDLGFTPAEVGAIMAVAAEPMLYANAMEGADQAPEVLQCLPEAYVTYCGTPPRRSPRALATGAGQRSTKRSSPACPRRPT